MGPLALGRLTWQCRGWGCGVPPTLLSGAMPALPFKWDFQETTAQCEAPDPSRLWRPRMLLSPLE